MEPAYHNQYHNGIGDVLITFWNNKILIILVILITFCACFFVIQQLPEKYKSSAILQIGDSPDSLQKVSISKIKGNIRLSSNYILSEAELVQSDAVLAKIFKANTEQVKVENQSFKGLKGTGFDTNAFHGDKNSPEISSQIRALQRGLTVSQVGNSYILKISFESSDPKKSMEVANAVALAYIEFKNAQVEFANKKSSAWLEDRIALLETQIENTNQTIKDYKTQNQLYISLSPATYERLLVKIMNDIEGKENEILNTKRIHSALENAGPLDGVSVLPEDYQLPSLYKDQFQNYRRLKEEATILSLRYGPKHPQIKDIKIKTDLAIQDLEKTYSTMREDVRTLQNEKIRTLKDLNAKYKVLLANKQKREEKQSGLEDLKREATMLQDIYEKYTFLYRQNMQEQDLLGSDARIITSASMPEAPSFPNKPLLLSLSLIIGIFAGIFIALLKAQISNELKALKKENRFKF